MFRKFVRTVWRSENPAGAASGAPAGTPLVARIITVEERQAFLQLLRPRPGLAVRLREMRASGLLAATLPESGSLPQAFRAISHLELLTMDAPSSDAAFASLLKELRDPELLVLSLLLYDTTGLDRLRLSGETRQTVDFLIRNRLRMARAVSRGRAEVPILVQSLASLFGTGEPLRMLTLMTLVELRASGARSRSRDELLWRLYVDTYNEITMAYGEDAIDARQAAQAAEATNLPADISEARLGHLLTGLPRRYLTLFDPETIYEHVRLLGAIGQNQAHISLKIKADLWEATVVTVDKPFLFSKICGVLAHFGMNIRRGYALTSSSSLVIDVFQFSDVDGRLEAEDARTALRALLSDVVRGQVEVAVPPQPVPRSTRRIRPIVRFDSERSPDSTVLELVADDVPGLLYRVSGIMSRHGIGVELVFISTERARAIDVFHLKKGGRKLTPSDEQALAADLERALETSDGRR